MTYEMTEVDKTLSVMSAAQIPRLQENVTILFTRVRPVLIWKILYIILLHFWHSVNNIDVYNMNMMY